MNFTSLKLIKSVQKSTLKLVSLKNKSTSFFFSEITTTIIIEKKKSDNIYIT